MDKAYEQKYHDLERNEWWFKMRRQMVQQLMKGGTNQKILDIGCASGLLLENLEASGFDHSNLYGIDVSEESIQKCQAKGFTNTWVMDGTQITLEKGSFDILVASDCLEHIEQDTKALDNWLSLLKPNGQLIVFVPAFMFLWSGHDVVNHHFRRYTKTELVHKIQNANFKIIRSGYWNVLLFFPITAIRLLKKLITSKESIPQSDLAQTPSTVNAILSLLLKIENWFIAKGLNFPFGVSTFCIAEKR